jgi:hypothetical protein
MSRMTLGLGVLVLLVSVASGASADVKHSGRIVAIGSGARVLTLEEVGPWTKHGHGPVRRAIELAPRTDIELVTRSEAGGPGQWPGGFIEAMLTASDLYVGDYVTVTAEGAKGHLVATRVEVVRPGASSAR